VHKIFLCLLQGPSAPSLLHSFPAVFNTMIMFPSWLFSSLSLLLAGEHSDYSPTEYSLPVARSL
jgi:hypothetical protein